MFAIEYAGIEPDLMTMAKSLAGGFPLSAVTGKADIMDGPKPGGLGGTYAGSPISCAAALAAIDAVEEEKLAERALRLGDLIAKRIRALSEESMGSCIGDIRHVGAMAAMELVTDRDTREPDADLTKAIVQKAATKGLILLSCGVRGNVVRFLPPLTASDELINEGLDILRESLLELRG
jgi:4-aminobutyrate aminotransferase/(S)-3-amino-2-methylpropionate transaminase